MMTCSVYFIFSNSCYSGGRGFPASFPLRCNNKRIS